MRSFSGCPTLSTTPRARPTQPCSSMGRLAKLGSRSCAGSTVLVTAGADRDALITALDAQSGGPYCDATSATAIEPGGDGGLRAGQRRRPEMRGQSDQGVAHAVDQSLEVSPQSRCEWVPARRSALRRGRMRGQGAGEVRHREHEPRRQRRLSALSRRRGAKRASAPPSRRGSIRPTRVRSLVPIPSFTSERRSSTARR